MTELSANIDRAAALIRQADGILITAGAGIGIDSGLPDFRGPQGFWGLYPALAKARIDFQDIANPNAFASSPTRAWGFYGHRLQLYRETIPHAGFDILLEIGKRLPNGYFVYTSNVDGQFQKAQFDEQRIVECHGSIQHLQCLATCTEQIWGADDLVVKVDVDGHMPLKILPVCPHCRRLARPNILMFSDWSWVDLRMTVQQARLDQWLDQVGKLVVIELGAGTAISSARRKGEAQRVPLIRVNPRESTVVGPNAIGIAAGALETLVKIKACLDNAP